jgi:putative phosphoribosyl transferase
MHLPIKDRTAAGRALAEALRGYADVDDLLVLALPRGGVPVASEVADALGAELDVLLVRKLGTPGQPELAMGAIASGGARVLNAEVIAALRVPAEEVERATAREQQELERRERAFRGDRERPRVHGRCVIVIDDGVATGATMRAGLQALHQQGPREVVVAVPVAAPDTVAMLEREADAVVCLETPYPFLGVGRWYVDFEQTTDAEVRRLLEHNWRSARWPR